MFRELVLLGAAQWAGSVPTWALLAVSLAVAWRVTRGGGGSAVSELSEANRVLEHRLQETRDTMGAEIRDLRVENAELKGRTDVTVALVPVLESLASHETRAQERHEGVVRILDLVARRLGPDPNGNGHDHEVAA